MQQHQLITLDNGARLIQRPLEQSEIVHCGLMINAGSRDENEANNGIAHFIEHSVFKGTSKRKAHHILTSIEKVGGELNAYTTREKTCYYVSCLKDYAEKAVDILTDIAFAATFPEKELTKEKKVIIEEIEMYDDSPDESIYDHFYSLAFPTHPLGFNILGTKDTVNNIGRGTINAFQNGHYTADKIILSITGNLTYKNGEKLARKYLSGLEDRKGETKRTPPAGYTTFEVKETKDFSQSHCIMGCPAYSKHDPKRYTLSLINNILGGSGMSSRLNMTVREKHGLTYHISSNYSSYQDAGVFSIYFACDKKRVNKCRDLIDKELRKMCEQKLSRQQLQQAKIQLLGQIALIDENQNIHMQSQAKSILDYGKYYSFKDFLRKVDEVTTDDVIEVCNELFPKERMSTLIYESE